jgi:heme-degrading monooxygenase HmoA
MIVRTWQARALEANAPRYEEHFRTEVTHKLTAIPGFQGAELLKRIDSGIAWIIVQTRWDSMDSVRKFAGSDPERAVVEPAAKAVLTEFDDRVRHFDVVVSYQI